MSTGTWWLCVTEEDNDNDLGREGHQHGTWGLGMLKGNTQLGEPFLVGEFLAVASASVPSCLVSSQVV